MALGANCVNELLNEVLIFSSQGVSVTQGLSLVVVLIPRDGQAKDMPVCLFTLFLHPPPPENCRCLL